MSRNSTNEYTYVTSHDLSHATYRCVLALTWALLVLSGTAVLLNRLCSR